MVTTILVICTQPAKIHALLSSLDAQYVCEVCDNAEHATAVLHKAASLVLLQSEVILGSASGEKARGKKAQEWKDFSYSCELSDIPTILFSLDGVNSVTMRSAVPWCAGTLDLAQSLAAQNDYLQLHMANQQLQYQLELAQGRLFEKNLELEEGLQSSAHIQQTLMPQHFPDLPELTFASRFIPCQSVGGDIFNVVRLDEQTVMVYMLDVSGHGVSAAMVTVSVFQALSPHTGQIIKQKQELSPYYKITEPVEVLCQLDDEYPFERFDKFFTMSYFLINPQTGAVRYANAAHPPTVLMRVDGSFATLDAEGTIVGMGGLVPYEEEQLTLVAGDRLFFYTDGIIEHENDTAELFGEQRLYTVLQQNRHLSIADQCQSVIDEITLFGGDRVFLDDVTLLGVEFVAAEKS